VVLGVFDKASAYGPGDIRQLTLLADGIWKNLTRRRVENRLRELNTELEQRVEERSRELRLAEDELMRNEKLASLGSLVAGIAHEISTPLGIAVTGGSYLVDGIEKMNQYAQEGGLDPFELAEFLDTGVEVGRSLNSNLARAASIIRTFKQVAVDQSGEMHRLMNLADVFQDILDTLRGPLKKNHVSVDFQCPDSIVFEHYPGDLGTILTNLVMNSLIHGYVAKDEGTITIAVKDKVDTVAIDYRDDGSGIADSIINQVFDPFFTTARNSGGTGLGLHIIRSIIVDRHGGRIDLDGGEGRGVYFKILMPKESPAVSRHDSGLTPV
jgi:two-component system NtrC family sensor kinase